MELASRVVTDRMWKSAHKAGVARTGCAVRVVAFNEARRTPKSSASPPAPPMTATAAPNVAVRPGPSGSLSRDRIESLSPSSLAASLVEYVQQAALEETFSSGQTPRGPVGDSQMFDAIARRLTQGVYDFDSNSLVDVLHAYSRAGQGRSNRDALAICCVVLSGKVDELSPANLARLATACAAMDLQATDLLSALCARAGEPEVLSKFTAADLVALLVALSQLQQRAPSLYADAADVVATELQLSVSGRAGAGPSRRPPLTPDQAVAALWSLAAADLYHRPLFDSAGVLLIERMHELDGNSLAKIAWSYATVRTADESHRALWDRDLFDSIAGVCLEQGVVSYPPRVLVTLLWSFASIPHFDGPLFDAVATALAPHLTAGVVSPSDLVAVAWSVMRVGLTHVALMTALGDAALAAVDRLDGDDLTTIALAFPAAKAYSDAFFKHLVSEAQERPQFFGQVAMLDIIRLISRVQHRDPDYYGPALQVLLEHVHKAFLGAPVDKAGCMNPFRFG